MLRIDTREKGRLPDKLHKLDNTVLVKLVAGDYQIDTKDGILVIERTRLDDFIGKIKSGRIDTQLDTCSSLSKNTMLILEGMHEKPHSKMSYISIMSKMASISQRGVQIICTRNSSETYEFIKKLHSIHSGNTTTKNFNRVKRKAMSLDEQALFMLMGANNIGHKTAERILEQYGSIAKIAHLMYTNELNRIDVKYNERTLYDVIMHTYRRDTK